MFDFIDLFIVYVILTGIYEKVIKKENLPFLFYFLVLFYAVKILVKPIGNNIFVYYVIAILAVLYIVGDKAKEIIEKKSVNH
jgi:hypothetical protein